MSQQKDITPMSPHRYAIMRRKSSHKAFWKFLSKIQDAATSPKIPMTSPENAIHGTRAVSITIYLLTFISNF